MNKNFTIELKRYLVNRVIEETDAEQLTRHNFVQKLWNEKLNVMGVDIPDKRVTIREKHLAQVFSYRLTASVNLAIKLKLIKNKQYRFSVDGEEHLTSMYVTTRIGNYFRLMPSFLQTIVLFTVLLLERVAGAAKRFRWLTGIISFVILSLKVLHSGLIDKMWIAFSALAALVIVSLLSLWR